MIVRWLLILLRMSTLIEDSGVFSSKTCSKRPCWYKASLIQFIGILLCFWKNLMSSNSSTYLGYFHINSSLSDLIYTLNGAMRIYENYYKIANHIIDKYEINTFLIKPDEPIITLLNQLNEYKCIYEDSIAVIYTRIK